MERYEVRSWVCDYGIWDNQSGEFVGKPFESKSDANRMFNLMFKGIKKHL